MIQSSWKTKKIQMMTPVRLNYVLEGYCRQRRVPGGENDRHQHHLPQEGPHHRPGV